MKIVLKIIKSKDNGERRNNAKLQFTGVELVKHKAVSLYKTQQQNVIPFLVKST